jgi:hypothetical protein
MTGLGVSSSPWSYESEAWATVETSESWRCQDHGSSIKECDSTGKAATKQGFVKVKSGGAVFNPSTCEAEAGGFLSSRPAWSTELAPGQPGLHRETLSQKNKKTKQNKTKKCVCGGGGLERWYGGLNENYPPPAPFLIDLNTQSSGSGAIWKD